MLTYLLTFAGELVMETERIFSRWIEKATALGRIWVSPYPLIGVILLSLGLWAAIWQAVAFLR